MISANLFFKDDDSAYFIKLGEKEHLDKFLNGEFRFTDISAYRNKKQSPIFDRYEGIEYIHHLRNGRKEYKYRKEKAFISCFSYFTRKDVLNNQIFSPKMLEEKKWSYTLFIFESEKFRNSIESALSNYKRESRLISYHDYSKNQDTLTFFDKSDEYAYEKEFRFIFFPNEKMMFPKKEQNFFYHSF